jgi:hypothetical protein
MTTATIAISAQRKPELLGQTVIFFALIGIGLYLTYVGG